MATCQIALSHRNYETPEEERKSGLEISLQVLHLHSQCACLQKDHIPFAFNPEQKLEVK